VKLWRAWRCGRFEEKKENVNGKKAGIQTMFRVKKSRHRANVGLFSRREMLNFWVSNNAAYISNLEAAAESKKTLTYLL